MGLSGKSKLITWSTLPGTSRPLHVWVGVREGMGVGVGVGVEVAVVVAEMSVWVCAARGEGGEDAVMRASREKHSLRSSSLCQRLETAISLNLNTNPKT
jgi:hypothetical protein